MIRRARFPALAGAAVFVLAVAWQNRMGLGFFLRTPGLADGGSVRAWFVNGLLPLSAAALLVLACWGLGTALRDFLARKLDGMPAAPGEPAVSAALGAGALATGLFLLGAAGLPGAGPFLALAALAAVSSWRPVLDALGLRRTGGKAAPRLAHGLLAGAVALAGWHALLQALAPPTWWDSLAHHLAVPKLHLAAGRIGEIPWLLHSHWPHLFQTLFMGPLALGWETGPALMHWAASGGLVFAVFRAGDRWMDRTAAWTAAALLAAQPAFLAIAGVPHGDGALALFHFAACLCLWSWSRSSRRGELVLGGLLSGFAAAAKLQGIVLLGALALWVFLEARRSGRREAVRRAALFALCGFAAVFPWYLKTFLGTGNPVWPFFSAALGGRWNPSLVDIPTLANNRAPGDLDFLFFEGAPFLWVPFAAAVALARLWQRPLPPALKLLLFPALPLALLVFHQKEAWRYLLPVFPALALTVGWAVSRAASGPWPWAAGAALVTALGAAPVLSANQNNQLFVVLGLRSSIEPDKPAREVYLERTLDHYPMCRWINGNLGPADKVLLFREVRGYYLDVDYMWGDPANQGLIDYARLGGPEALAARLRGLGVTHVLVNERIRAPYYDERTLSLMEETLARDARPVRREGPLVLHELAR